MPVEFIGFVGNQNASETIPRQGSVLDLDYVETLAKLQENGGFDRVCSPSTPHHPSACSSRSTLPA